jgi:hypothetical protein
MRSVLAVVTVALALLGAAHACPPPPPEPPPAPGETIEAWRARLDAEAQARAVEQRRQWWGRSELVLLARIVRTDSIPLRDFSGREYDRFPRVFMRPVRWLKGSGSSRRFHLNWEGMTDCGPYGGGEAASGHIGDLVVVFVREGRPSPANVGFSLAPEHIVDPELRARVDAANR